MAARGSFNRVELLGWLGADPESRILDNDTQITQFRVATNYGYRTAEGEDKTETEWTPVVTWRKLAEHCNEYLQKGSRVFVTGRLRTRSWNDDTGTAHYRTEVQADEVLFLDTRQPADEHIPE